MPNMKSHLLKTLGIVLAFSAVLAVSAAALAADSYPSMPVRFIVPFAPGGGVDITGRLIAAKLSERLGKQVVVENHAGGGSIVGTEMVAKANPDGYTLLVITTSHNTQPLLQKLPYDPVKSFTPIAFLGDAPYVLVIHPSVPATSVKELIALAKQKPGQLIFGTSGLGAGPHMSAELFQMMADIEVKIVHFKGAGPALIDVLGGHSHATICSSVSALPHINSGKLRVLGTGFGGVKRSVVMPGVPTIAEAGLPGYKSNSWYAILGPAGMPVTIIDRLNKELKAILDSDEVKKQFLASGTEVNYLDPTEFSQFLKEDVTMWARVVKKANIKME
jgi:tripartite-type tricarboxylate transporter receptor subunit TctC